MKRTFFLSIALTLLITVVSGLAPNRTWACEGTFRPNCGQTAWLAKFISSSIVLPGSGSSFTVPIGLIPYLLWNPTAPCAQPTTASLELTLTCTAAGGGSPIVIGPTSVPVAVPVLPGAQAVLTGANNGPVLGGPFQFPISGGTLPVGNSYSCLVQGAFVTGFGPGTGAPQVTGVGDSEVCIVEPAPGSPEIPRLDLTHITHNGPFTTVRRGDQAYNTYLIQNNDPDQAAHLTIHSSTNQVARLPGDADPDTTLFALSNPAPDSDDFRQSRQRNLTQGSLVDQSHPEASNPGLTFQEFLAPHDLEFETIVTGTHGMCADGSCSEALIKATGFFDNGDPLLGCAGTAIIVDDVLARTHQCEITDMLQTSPTVDSQWSPAVFDNDPHMTTHGAGNLDTGGGTSPPGTQTTGDVLRELFNIDGFPPMASDYLRTQTHPSSVRWQSVVFDQAANFEPKYSDVIISNLPGDEFNIVFPSISRDGDDSFLQIQLDHPSDHVFIFDVNTEALLYEGYFAELVNSPPTGISVDLDTYRKISKTPPSSMPLLGTRPYSYSNVHSPSDPPFVVPIEVIDPRNNQALAWSASSDNALITLNSTNGNAGEDISVNYNPMNIAGAPDVTVGLLEISNPQAVNSPIFLPIAARTTTGPGAQSQDINPGVAGAHYNVDTSGQGVLLDIQTADRFMFAADFSWDAMVQAAGAKEGRNGAVEALPNDADEQRWFTAQGNYYGNRADLTIFQTRNGVFNDPAVVSTVPVGSMVIEFSTCTESTIIYDMPEFGLSGVIPSTKLLGDVICSDLENGQLPAYVDRKSKKPGTEAQDINYGLIGAWYNPLTSGQGFLFDFIPDTQFMFVAAFTFDINSPQEGGNIPGAEQRWYTAQGNYSGNRADLTVYQSRGGVFDDPAEVTTVPVGTMVVEFDSCTSANISFVIPDLDISAEIPVTKLLADELCTQAIQGNLLTGY